MKKLLVILLMLAAACSFIPYERSDRSDAQPVLFQVPMGYTLLDQRENATMLAVDILTPEITKTTEDVQAMIKLFHGASKPVRVTLCARVSAERRVEIGDIIVCPATFWVGVNEDKTN